MAITTKGTLIERDLDLLAPMAAQGLVRVGISVTTLDAGLSRQMEPRAPRRSGGLQMIRRLTAAGVPVRVMVAPVIPGLTDHELEPILAAAQRCRGGGGQLDHAAPAARGVGAVSATGWRRRCRTAPPR